MAAYPDPIVKRGYWLEGPIRSGIRIVRSQKMYGTGNPDDPPEIANDRDVECYYVIYDSPSPLAPRGAAGGAYLTLEDAVAAVQKTTKAPVVWESGSV